MSTDPETTAERLRILVAVDRSAPAVRAAVAAHKAFGDDAEYTVVSVAKGDAAALRDGESPLPMTIPFDLAAATERGEMREVAHAIAQSALGPGARAAGLVAPRPGKMICDVARDIHADYVVIGASRRGLLKRIFTRSVGRYVVLNAPCPILVAR